MKKKILIGVIITLLIAVIAVEGVIIFKQMNDKKENQQEPIANEARETEEPTMVPTKKPVKVPETTVEERDGITIKKEYFAPEEDELVYTYMQVTISHGSSGDFNYTWEIPQFNINSSDAKKLNKEILDKWNDVIAVEETSDGLVGVTYETIYKDNIVYLIIHSSIDYDYTIGNDYDVYCINIETGDEVVKSNNSVSEEHKLVYTYLEYKTSDDVYKLPQININSSDVRKINEKILNKWEPVVKEIRDFGDINLLAGRIEYTYFINDKILSLYVQISDEFGSFDCEVYNVDITTGQEISNEELIKHLKISENSLKSMLHDNIERIADYYKEDEIAVVIDEEWIKNSFERAMYNNIEDAKMFLNEKGNLSMYIKTKAISIAIADDGPSIWVVDLKDKNIMSFEYTGRGYTVKYVYK